MNVFSRLKAIFLPRICRGGDTLFYRIPWFSASISLLSIVVTLSPNGLIRLCFDRLAIEQGEWWRLITGHLVHSSYNHLLWDVLAFFCIAAYVELKSIKLLWISLIGGFVAVNLLLLSSWSGLSLYCGLSGMLFAPLTLALWLNWQRSTGIYAVAPVIICAGKLVWEISQSNTFFVTSGWPAYPLAHVAGVVGGLAVCILIYAGSQLRRLSSNFGAKI